jgi:hypothetical protein
MPRDSQYARQLQQTSSLTSLPAPVGGLNARDALASMPPTQAVVLENFFPSSEGMQVRRGWYRHYRNVPGSVETLIKYNDSDGTEKLFACANNSFIDVSIGGTYGAGDVKKSGFTNNRWQYTQLANLAGDFTVAVNGADTPQAYNGTAWVDLAITANATTYPGFDPKKLIHVTQMHRRLWFVEKDSPRVWYLPTDVIQGEVVLFDCGEVFPLGGYCQACLSWSVDTGSGMDDQSVFISSKGNIAVFTGFDPDDATSWMLAGVYTVGATVGRRCACPYGSDVIILTENGAMTLTSILSQSKTLMQPPLTDVIQHALSNTITQFSTYFGWDLFTNARYNQLYLNVPDPDGVYQFVMNTILDAWTSFIGYSSLCWENLYEEPMFGSNGFVGRAWSGNVDDPNPTTAVGSSIQTRCLQAFSYFGGPQQKSWSLARPVFLADAEPVTSVSFNVDFETVDDVLPLPPYTNAVTSFVWDTAKWDAALWSGQSQSFKRWFGLNDIGFTGAIFLRTASVTETKWLATDFQFHTGGTL